MFFIIYALGLFSSLLATAIGDVYADAKTLGLTVNDSGFLYARTSRSVSGSTGL